MHSMLYLRLNLWLKISLNVVSVIIVKIHLCGILSEKFYLDMAA